METEPTKSRAPVWGLMLVAFLLGVGAREVAAHCDTLEGPVVKAAKQALDRRELGPVIVWIDQEQEAELEAVFRQVLTVREKGSDAQRLADMYFFETVVRLHRAAEGEPYTGLKPSGTVEPIALAADEAIEQGNVEKVLRAVEAEVRKGIRTRFAEAMAAKRNAAQSVETGRLWVRGYIEFRHYVEALDAAASSTAEHPSGVAEPLAPHGP